MDYPIIQSPKLITGVDIETTRISSLKDLLIQQVRMIHDGELCFQQTFPFIKSKNKSDLLKEFLTEFERGKRIQRDRLDSLFGYLKVTAKGEKNHTIHSICRQTRVLMTRCQTAPLLNPAILIYLGANTNSLLGSYEIALDFATKLNHWEADGLLYQNVKYEKKVQNQLKLIEKDIIEQLIKEESTDIVGVS